MKAVVFTGAGGGEVVRIEERDGPNPQRHEVVVAVTVAGMNPADVHQREGHYPAPPGAVADIPGLEVAGVVVAAGSDVTRWRQGDRVFGIVGGGGLADRVVVDEGSVTSIPANLGDEEAAAVPEAYITANDAIRQAELLPDDSIFVRAATGAVGTAAVQIASAYGARVLSDLAEAGPQGVNAVIELLGGTNVADDLAALAVGGRIIVVGLATGRHVHLDLRALMAHRATIRGTVLRARSVREKADAVAAFALDVVPLLEAGTIRPEIDSVWTTDDIEGAFERVGQRGKRGKVLLRIGDADGAGPLERGIG